jgi:Skp family chaperone for outer membrane proteins
MNSVFRNLLLFTFVFTIVTSFSFVSKSFAETKIAVVDVQRLLGDSNAAKSIQEQLIDQKKLFDKDLDKVKSKLENLEKDIISRKDSLSEEQLLKEKQKFEAELLEANKKVQKRGNELEQAASVATLKLRAAIVKIVAEISDAENYTMVVTKQNVILAEKELDITEKVMDKLNKSVKTIKLEIKS